MKAVVVGAGIIGASVAYRLAQKGVEVTVLEGDRPAAGTSTSTFAWVNANGKTPRDYFDLNLAGVHEHRHVAEELGGSWFHPGGDLEWADDEAADARLGDKVARMQEWGGRIEWRTAAELRELEPDLALVADSARIAHSIDDAFVDPVLLTAELLAAARRFGARLRSGAAVTAA
ncbi:MAG TPA: FAD-dependent oxidoreductase, partial [Candidatus Limnocylindria bacterium]|nr:FAD-dependent oxidoreductase [Candidatus Limnocylindria bacterium]